MPGGAEGGEGGRNNSWPLVQVSIDDLDELAHVLGVKEAKWLRSRADLIISDRDDNGEKLLFKKEIYFGIVSIKYIVAIFFSPKGTFQKLEVFAWWNDMTKMIKELWVFMQQIFICLDNSFHQA